MDSIVALHGLNSHPIRNWSTLPESDASINWLRDLMPEISPNARVLSFGYDTRFIGPSNAALLDDARDLLARLHAARNGQEVILESAG